MGPCLALLALPFPSVSPKLALDPLALALALALVACLMEEGAPDQRAAGMSVAALSGLAQASQLVEQGLDAPEGRAFETGWVVESC